MRHRLVVPVVLCAALLAVPSRATAGPIGWTVQVGTSVSDSVEDVAPGPSGSVVTSGTTSGLMGATSIGGQDIVVSRLAANGTTQWVTQFGTAGDDYDYAVDASASGEVFVTGGTDGTFDATPASGNDGFVAKLDRKGKLVWVTEFRASDTAGSDYGTGVAVARSGAVYVSGTTADQNGSVNGQALLNKYDRKGKLVWSRTVNGSAYDEWTGVAVSPAEDVYVFGTTSAGIDGPTLGSADLILARYDKNGNQKWFKQFGTVSNDLAGDIAVTASGKVVISGSTSTTYPGSLASVQGGTDVLAVMFDKNGVQQWVTHVGGSASDYGVDIDVAKDGTSYLTGYTMGALPGSAANGSSDAHVIRLSPTGALVWARNLGTASDDGGAGIALRSSNANGGAIIVGGYTSGTLFGHASAGGYDGFVVALPTT